ncbi:MAG: M15 family metallopeptidase [Bacteroidota bacterium]
MRKIILILLVIAAFTSEGFTQNKKANPYNLPITGTIQEYRKECNKNGRNKLVDIQKAIPGIQLDIRYATTNNFTGKKVYSFSNAFLRQPAVDSLAVVEKELAKKGLGLKVFDAYRPYAATLMFHEVVKDTMFAASPATGSKHNRGCSIDVSLIDLKTGQELMMPTGYDDFSERAGAQYSDLPAEAKENREILIMVMEKHGFKVLPSEWWHFDFDGWQSFSLMDISAQELVSM